ncbi:DNA invertase from prophage CP-933H [Escherichia coli]|nr:recombinase family protein [Escherichia coli]CTS99303.1 DNA invertase from prophage CP-933H [Escherichia coli]
MLIGYVRVSTNDQNTDLQRNALNCAGCELIFEDKISGTKSERPGLKKLLRTLSAGDTLVVWKLDRLGRSMRHLVVLVEELRERGINFRSLTDSIDTSTPMGRFFFHVMGPENTTTIAPLTSYDKWDGEKWVTDTEAQHNAAVDAAEVRRQSLIDAAMASISLIQLKLQAGRKLTQAETTRLNAVLDYIDAVTATDTSTAPDVIWPELPEA